MKKLLVALTLFVSPAFAGDIPPPIVKAPVIAPVVNCATSANCSGFYGTFGIANNADLAAGLNSGATNGVGILAGVGYQLWKGQVLAGVEVTAGAEFGTAGSKGGYLGTEFVKLGYNFFPSTASAPTAPGQSPLTSFVPANLLAASTPYIIAGGAQRHGISQGAAGLGIETIIAAGWSSAFEWYNAPSTKGMPDENVFRIMAQKHF